MINFEELKKWFPLSWRLRPNGMVEAVFFAVGNQLDALDEAVINAENQLTTQTATWTLSIREADLGLPVAPAELSIEQRRMKILAKEQGLTNPTIPRLEGILNEFIPDKSGKILVDKAQKLIIAEIPDEILWVNEAAIALRNAAYARDEIVIYMNSRYKGGTLEISSTYTEPKVFVREQLYCGAFTCGGGAL